MARLVDGDICLVRDVANPAKRSAWEEPGTDHGFPPESLPWQQMKKMNGVRCWDSGLTAP